VGCTVVEELEFVEENANCDALLDDVIALAEDTFSVPEFRDEYDVFVLENIIDVENITGTLEPDMLLREADEEYRSVHAREADFICRGLALASEGIPSQSVVYFYKVTVIVSSKNWYIYGFTDVHR